MRKIVLLLTVGILAIVGVSCEKSNEKLIIGEWKLVQFYINDSIFYPSSDAPDLYILRFKRNGECTGSTTIIDRLSGDYVINDSIISISISEKTDVLEGAEDVYIFIEAINMTNLYYINNNSLILYFEDNNCLTFKRN